MRTRKTKAKRPPKKAVNTITVQSGNYPDDVQVPFGAVAEVLGICRAAVRWRQRHKKWPFAKGRRVKASEGWWPDERGVPRRHALLSLDQAIRFHRPPYEKPRHIKLTNGQISYAQTIPLTDEQIRCLGGREGDDELIDMATLCLDYGVKPITYRKRQRGKKPRGWLELNGATLREFPRWVPVPWGKFTGKNRKKIFHLRSEADKTCGEQEPGVYVEEKG